jgi:exfoliative toxin A/B
MPEIVKRVPVSIAGLMLGLAGLGNLSQVHGSQYRYLAGILTTLIALLLIANFFVDKEGFLAQLENPIVASVTAPTFNYIQLGQIIFWGGFSFYMVLLPTVTYRVLVIREIKKAALPTISIFTASAGLCLAGYMSVFANKNLMIVGG